MFSPLINELIQAFRCLPGIGLKTAQRMAFQILERQRPQGLALANSLQLAIEKVGNCKACRTFCETEFCGLCSNPARHSHQLCIVESPADVIAIEQTATFRGYYFVLMGRLSPIDGIGPQQIGINQLIERLDNAQFTEVILATNPTIEGEATAHYLANLIREKSIACTRLAHGIPMGGELEYLDGSTLSRAFTARTAVA
ncbi:MAG: recombination mediator RecR [Gammaproteobacteria bacterium]|nr:recombination mediator RecR [Gammaproteobacteria bacterium]